MVEGWEFQDSDQSTVGPEEFDDEDDDDELISLLDRHGTTAISGNETSILSIHSYSTQGQHELT